MGNNTGQAVLTVVGTAVGAYFGQPQLGMALGSLAGQALFPTQLPTVRGPQIDDLRVQTSALGAPIPICYGTVRVAGNVIWSSGIIETKNKTRTGGKGTPEQKVVTYTYKVNCAIGICEGPIVGIRRVWANETLIYDARPWMPEEGESLADYAQRLNQNLNVAMQVRIGDESQEPDEVMEAWLGVGNVPAYRGLAYVIFENFQLAGFGNRLPSFTFEVAASAIGTSEKYAGEVYPPWTASTTDPRNPNASYDYKLTWSAPSYGFTTPGATWGYSFEEILASGSCADTVAAYTNLVYPTTTEDWKTALHGYTPVSSGAADVNDRDGVLLHVHSGGAEGDIIEWSDAGWIPTAFSTTAGAKAFSNWVSTTYGYAARTAKFTRRDCIICPGNIYPCTVLRPSGGGVGDVEIAFGTQITVRRLPGPPPPEDDASPWLLDTLGRDYKRLAENEWALAKTTGNAESNYITRYGVDPCIPDTHPDYDNQVFWENAYDAAVAAGDLPAGWTYGVDYPVAAEAGYFRDLGYATIDSIEPVPLGDIVSDICARCGLDAVDASELTTEVIGYTVTRTMPGRAAIEPLMRFESFDAVESGQVVKFPMRAGAEVATLTSDDLAAHLADQQRPTAIEVRRQQDVELPRSLRVHYINQDREYEAGEQYASRLTTNAINVVDVEIPVVMSDEQAAQRAEILLYEAWTARNRYVLAVDQSWMMLEPGDPIVCPVDGFNERLRITEIDHQLPGILRLEAVRDDDGVYVSYVVAPTQAVFTQALATAGATSITLLDLPALNDSDNDGGYYVSATGSGNAWAGATIFSSVDGGDTYTDVGTISAEAITANIVGDVPAGITTTWDDSTVITLDADVDAAFENRTEQAVFEGANMAAIGAAGRWEIIQFTTATLVGSPPQWQLTGLLRGRRGTEHNVGSTVDGDTFVLLSEGGLLRIPLANNQIGQTHLIKGVTIGKSLDTVTAEEFTSSGMALMPFSPVYIAGERDGSGNLTISWIRRDRLNRELMSGTDIPNSDLDTYEVDIYDGATVVRSLWVVASAGDGLIEQVYTAAQIDTDFGSPTPESIYVKVYQRSSVLGRGFAGEATI